MSTESMLRMSREIRLPEPTYPWPDMSDKRIKELTAENERLRILAMGYLCDKLRLLRETQLAHGVTPTCQLCLCAD
ncbi:MAG: hypothetical protein RR672_13220, partial [Raoultibacter sp.]